MLQFRQTDRQTGDWERRREIIKYKDLTILTQRMWNVKTKVTPVITGAAGRSHLNIISDSA
jgi:hypothetical protein